MTARNTNVCNMLGEIDPKFGKLVILCYFSL